MALQHPSDFMVPLKRILPVVSGNVGMAARRVVRGRLRFFVRTGLRIYVPQEDYLSLCEAAWDKHVRRSVGARCGKLGRSAQPPLESASSKSDQASVKPIHDGRPLDRYHKSPIFRLARVLVRWLRRS